MGTVDCTNNYLEIPEDIRNRMREKANAYYGIDFYNYNKKKGLTPTYIWGTSQILVITVKSRLIFRYGQLPTEPFAYGTEKSKVFLDEVSVFCRNKLKLDWLGPSGNGALFMETPEWAITIPFGSHVIDLTMTEEELWGKIHSKHRNVIRKAEKNGVRIIKGGAEHIDEYLKIDVETWRRSGIHADNRSCFLGLFEEFGKAVSIYLAYLGDSLQGGAIFLRNHAMSYYLYGATIDLPATGAMNLLHWNAIKDCKTQGIKKYSFVGCRINEDKESKYHGIQRFKERFGGELVVGKMFKVIYKPFKYRLYKILLAIKAGAWPRDIIDQERHKWEKPLQE